MHELRAGENTVGHVNIFNRGKKLHLSAKEHYNKNASLAVWF